jgi:hypothetical protein
MGLVVEEAEAVAEAEAVSATELLKCVLAEIMKASMARLNKLKKI